MNDIKRITKNKKGFTLAELLIVVAIIGVLVAISIPIFTSQLKKARLATNQANARAAYAAAEAQFLQNDTKYGTFVYTTSSGTLSDSKDPTKENGATAITSTDINAWTTDTGSLGSTIYKTWYVTVSSSGTITRYRAK